MASGEIFPILKEALVNLTSGRRPLTVLVSIANITDKFILGLDVLHVQSQDELIGDIRDGHKNRPLGSIRCDWAMNKYHCGAQRRDHVHPIIGRETWNWHGRVAAVGLQRLIEAADSLAGRGSRASHQAEATTPVQPLRVVLVTMTSDRRSRKNIE
jgi:hypothetical protein